MVPETTVLSHVKEYTLTGVLSEFPDIRRGMCAKKIYWVVDRIEIRERSIAVFQCLAVIDICWRTTVMPHWHLCSDKFNMVLCLGVTNYCDVWEPGLILLRLGGAHFTLCRFLPCCAKTVHCSLFFLVVLHIYYWNEV